jgi:putative Ca2+/H+ antiporter (TMEM165/GDT1 family)
MADSAWSERGDKVFVSTVLFDIGYRLSVLCSVAPALLITESLPVLWEVTWLNRSSQRFLCR